MNRSPKPIQIQHLHELHILNNNHVMDMNDNKDDNAYDGLEEFPL